MGKLEAGTIKKGESLVLLPNKINVTVEEIFIDQGEGTVSLGEAAPGDNIKMKIKGVEEVCPVEVCQLCVFSPQACCCRRVAECHILLTSRRARRIKFGWGMSCAARKACADPASGLTRQFRCPLPLRLLPSLQPLCCLSALTPRDTSIVCDPYPPRAHLDAERVWEADSRLPDNHLRGLYVCAPHPLCDRRVHLLRSQGPHRQEDPQVRAM